MHPTGPTFCNWLVLSIQTFDDDVLSITVTTQVHAPLHNFACAIYSLMRGVKG